MKEKYQGRVTSSATPTDTIATITERNYALIPIQIDQHLGKLGYTAHKFFGIPDTQFPPTKPPWNQPANISRTNKFAFKANIFATNSRQHFYTAWKPRGENCQVAHMETPTTLPHPQYGSNKLRSLNISIAIAKHLTNTRNRLTNHNKEIYDDIHGSTPYPFTKAKKFHNFQRLTCSTASNDQYL